MIQVGDADHDRSDKSGSEQSTLSEAGEVDLASQEEDRSTVAPTDETSSISSMASGC